jgi:ABC-type branched-subunit amino acid transport system ATPase component/predicted MFS family arabinose efflux permease
MSATPPDSSAATSSQLAATFLDLEADRDATASPDVAVVADDELLGVGDDEISFGDGLRRGGPFTFGVLASLTALDELESATLGVLAPDIRASLGVSTGAIVFISASAGGFLVLGSLPMGWLADRYRRGRVIGIASLVFAAMVFLSGLVTNAFQLFWTRFGVGVAKANQLPVHGSLLADTYPIGVRGRVSSYISTAGRLTGTLSPLLVGAIAALAGGSAGWRWAFMILAIPAALAALLAFRLPEPPRGQHEKLDVIGEVFVDDKPAKISMEAAFSRLMQVRTIRLTILAFAAMGFGLFTVPVLSNLYMEERFDASTFTRGAVATTGGVCVLVTLPFVGGFYDRLYRRDPSRALRLVGICVLPAALLTPLQYYMPNLVLFAILGIPTAVLLSMAFAMVGPVLSTVVPYRLRGMGSALSAIYIFFVGATGGAVLSALFVNAIGIRATVVLLSVPSTVIGGLMILRGSSFIKSDLAMVVAEIKEEQEETERQRRAPENIPAIQVHGVDFSYGPVQILFDVGFEVRRGEVLALLGTNGAGKSTVLRVIAGLGTPARGVVRLGGRTITYTSPEERARLGVALLAGGKGVFGNLTVRENMEMATFQFRSDRVDMERRIDDALGLFPELSVRTGELASSLSGGQQQMVALAQTLATEPDVLIIDELSLGLAPIMVERIVAIVEQLRSTGLTMIIVEQSLNVASAIADRAVFMEKGRVRFEGPIQDLVDRNDLVRAVFLGSDGG